MNKLYTLLSVALFFTFTASSQSLVISQVYAGGGSANATYNASFVELFNAGNSAVSLSGWSVQTLGSVSGSWNVVKLPAVTLNAGQYFLVSGTTGNYGAQLPTSDATANFNLAYESKVALLNTTGKLSGGCSIQNTIDWVTTGNSGTYNCYKGSGATGSISNTTAAVRKNNGYTNTNDNSYDFAIAVVHPHNSSSSAATTTTTANSRTITTLPVRLTHFSVQAQNNDKALINWTVNEEVNFHHYEVEYSTNGKDFTTATMVLPVEGNGTKTYQSKVTLATTTAKHFFRLKMVDEDRTVKYSSIIMLSVATSINEVFTLKINPAQTETAVAFDAVANDQSIKIELISAVGQIMYTKEVSSVKANPVVWINNLSHFTKGLYYVRVSNQTLSQVQKLLIQ